MSLIQQWGIIEYVSSKWYFLKVIQEKEKIFLWIIWNSFAFLPSDFILSFSGA